MCVPVCVLKLCVFPTLTTVEIFLFPNVALTRHLYSVGSGTVPFLGGGLLRPSSEEFTKHHENTPIAEIFSAVKIENFI